MDSKYNHDIRSVNGKYIQMPPYKAGQTGWGNLVIPSPYEEEDAAKYPISTKFWDGDRIWRYCQAGNGLVVGRVAHAWNAYGTPTSGSGTYRETGTIQAAALINARTIYCTDQDSAVIANLYAGGYAMIYWEFLCLRIESNTAEDDPSAGIFGVTFDNDLPVAIDAASVVSLYRDIYADVRYLGGDGSHSGWGSGVCVPNYTKTDEYYFWGQTWGPCGLAGTDNYGQDISERSILMGNDGAALWGSADVTKDYQYLGHLIPYTGDGPTGSDQPGAFIFVFLQIAP